MATERREFSGIVHVEALVTCSDPALRAIRDAQDGDYGESRMKQPAAPKQFVGDIHYEFNGNGAVSFGPESDFLADNQSHARIRTEEFVEGYLDHLIGLHECDVTTEVSDVEEPGE